MADFGRYYPAGSTGTLNCCILPECNSRNINAQCLWVLPTTTPPVLSLRRQLFPPFLNASVQRLAESRVMVQCHCRGSRTAPCHIECLRIPRPRRRPTPRHSAILATARLPTLRPAIRRSGETTIQASLFSSTE